MMMPLIFVAAWCAVSVLVALGIGKAVRLAGERG